MIADDGSVHQEGSIDASPQRVFEAWADPEEIARWYVDRAEGDPREDDVVRWFLGDEPEHLSVKVCEPGRRLVLKNVDEGPWNGTVVEVELTPRGEATRVKVIQRTPSEELADWVPTVDSGWACTLAILKEYLENHAPHERRVAEARREVEPDPQHAAEALASADAIQDWDGETPERVLAATPHGAVAVFPGFSGVFTLMAAGQLVVWYATWGDEDMEPAKARVEGLADRLAGRVVAPHQSDTPSDAPAGD